MSRTHKPSREQPSSLDAWQQHDAFYAKFKATVIRQALAAARTHLQPVFIEHARFSEECGIPTVSLSFLIDNLRQASIIPPLTSHNYKLGLQICISPDLTSPLRSPSKNHSDQRIHFDTFVEAFAFSLFCYPIEERSATFCSAPNGDEQQIECFADDINTAVHRFVDTSRVNSRHNIDAALHAAPDASENGSHSISVSNSSNSEQSHQNIQEERSGYQTDRESCEEQPSTPVQQTDKHQSAMKFTERRGGARGLHGNSEREHSTSQTPINFYTPRCNFPAASPRRLPTNPFPTIPGTLKWFTPRHSVAKLSPDIQKAVQGQQANTVSLNQTLELSFQAAPTSSTPSLPYTNTGRVSSYGENSVPIADSNQDVDAPTAEILGDCAKVLTDVGSDEWESSEANVVEDVEDSEEEAALSPESNFQSPEIGDGPPPLLRIAPDDDEASRKLLFCESEDDGNMSDESSRYESDGERTTPAFKLSQIEEFGQHIEEPGEVTDFEGEDGAALVEAMVVEPEVGAQSIESQRDWGKLENGDIDPVQELKTEEDAVSEIDACNDVKGMSPSALLPDRVERASQELSFDVEFPLFGSVASPGRSENCRSDLGFDSLGEGEQAELLYSCGNLSDSSELSMRTRETYSRMLDSFIENGSFSPEVSSHVITEDDYTPPVQCCLNLESIIEDASHEEQQEETFVQDPTPAYCFPDSIQIDTLECPTEDKPNAIDQDPALELEAQEVGEGMEDSNHTTDTVVSHAPSKTSNETFGNDIRRAPHRTMSACCEEIVDPHTCAPLQESTETASKQCVSEEAEKGSVASVMATKDDPTSHNGELTPEDFDVVRKPIKALASFDPFSGSPLGSVCTKTSEEHRESRIQSDVVSPPVANRKSQDVNQDPTPHASDENERKEPTIIVQCNNHLAESHILAALRENTELCRMLREEVEARRRSDSLCGRLWNFLEGLLIVMIVGWMLLVGLENWMAHARFTKVLM